MLPIALVVIAKEPRPGSVKTRLTPPCTPTQAAALAGAALRDTIDVVASTPAARRVLVFEGEPAGWCTDGMEMITQRGGGLAERLAGAFADVCGPALLVGMDTPQLTRSLLIFAMRALARPEVDAVLGPTEDGGYWTVGFKRPAPDAFAGVPMSTAHTASRQREQLRALGLRVRELPILRDVDTIADARAVARAVPGSRFAARLAEMGAALA